MAKAELVPIIGQNGAFRVAMEWGEELDLPPETDGGAVEDGYVSISYLSRLHEIDRPDLAPAEQALTELVPSGASSLVALDEPAQQDGDRRAEEQRRRRSPRCSGRVRTPAAHTAMHSATPSAVSHRRRISHARAAARYTVRSACPLGYWPNGSKAHSRNATRRPTATT